MKSPRLLALAGMIGVCIPALAATSALSSAEELALIFRPFETDLMTLSPDGRYLAYTERRGEELFLVLRDLSANTIARVPAAEDRALEMSGAKEKTPARITFLRWAANGRLVFNLNQRNVWSIRADGQDPRRIADPRDFAPPTASVGALRAPPSVQAALARLDQPVNVVALRRNENHVYIDAERRDRGVMTSASVAPMTGDLTVSQIPVGVGPVRAVTRFDLGTGKQSEMGEVEANAFEIIVDQQGRPRLARLREHARALTTSFIYREPRGATWKALDALLGSDLPMAFNDTPENHLGERSFPLGFDYDPDIFYFASNVGRDTFGIYALDTKKKTRTDVAVDIPVADLVRFDAVNPDTLVFDDHREKLVGIRYIGAERATLWLDHELAEIQRSLDQVDREQRWEIVEWDDPRERFLVLATSQANPGVYYVYHRDSEILDEVMSRAPWLTDTAKNAGASFGFQTKSGVNLSGYLTLPRRPILQRPPLVVLCHDGPWSRDNPGYHREAQALAWMGFMVLQVNYRGSAGFGRKHLEALRDAPDTAALDDILAAIEAVTPKNADRRLVAIMGTGYGGYLALRAMQLHPTRFRCAVAIDAPVDLPTWTNPPSRGFSFAGELRRGFFRRDKDGLREISPLTHPEKIVAPVMLIERGDLSTGRSADLARALKALERDPVYLSLTQDEAADLPRARAELFLKIAEFFNANIYNYAVKLGETVIVE